MDQALKKQIKKYAVMTLIMLIMALAVGKLNQVNKTQLINRTGQTFETGKVVRILEDNIQEDGMRVGQQTVVVKMTSGVKKGQELTTTSSAGYLFGAAWYCGYAGGGSSERCGRFGDHKRVFHGPERSRDRICGALPVGIVHGRRDAGRERRSLRPMTQKMLRGKAQRTIKTLCLPGVSSPSFASSMVTTGWIGSSV